MAYCIPKSVGVACVYTADGRFTTEVMTSQQAASCTASREGTDAESSGRKGGEASDARHGADSTVVSG